MPAVSRSVLIVDNDREVAEVARAVLLDEGYQVNVLRAPTADAFTAAVAQLEPDVILLDGESEFAGYGQSWGRAASLAERVRRIPVVMFTANDRDVKEAREGQSMRSQHAHFAAIVGKPFEIDELLHAVAAAVDHAGS